MDGSSGDYSHLADLEHTFKVTPVTVKGRILHIDGDFLPYQYAFPEDLPYATLRENMFNGIENRRVAAGAEYVQVHLTHPLSDKAQRFDIAVSEPYQGNRTNKSHPKHWHSLNSLLHDKAADDAKYVSWQDREADDAMTQAQWNAYRNGTQDLCVHTSNDKDIRQVAGWYLDWKTNELKFREHKHYYQEALASPDSYELSTTLKQGSLFHGVWFLLWQMLQGDSTDNIPALGNVSGAWLMEHMPSECSKDALSGKTPQKDKSCGPVLAAKILGAIGSGYPSLGYALVKDLYQYHYPDTWVEYFKEQWQLLGLYYSDNDDRLTMARAIRDGVFDEVA
jgi:hypothetical protein